MKLLENALFFAEIYKPKVIESLVILDYVLAYGYIPPVKITQTLERGKHRACAKIDFDLLVLISIEIERGKIVES